MPATGPDLTTDLEMRRTLRQSGGAEGNGPGRGGERAETPLIAALGAALLFPLFLHLFQSSGAWMIADGWAGVVVNLATPLVYLLPFAFVRRPWRAWRASTRRAALVGLAVYAVAWGVPRAVLAAAHAVPMLRDVALSRRATRAARAAMRERPTAAALRAAERGDTSFLAVAGTGYGGAVPGILNTCVIARATPRVIVGTGVAPDAPTQGVFQRRAEEFAMRYNRVMATQMGIAPEELDTEAGCSPAGHHEPWPPDARIGGP
ncbi:MAG TPA: hypothetical protein VFJ82_23680 [Longimicrobium sp.]|nr:hypothetical protein [Longimicrobium sp.]